MIYRFDDIAYNITTKRVPTPDDNARYIGLEHLDPGELYVKRYGSNVDLKGDKLVMTKGDILFGKRNTYLKRVAIAPFDGLFSAHGMIFHPKEDVIDKRYFPFFINSDAFMDEAIRISVGSLSPTVNWKDLKDLKFDIPPIEEQKQIADKLWIAYDLKSKYANLVESIDEMVKSQFIEMFGTLDNHPAEYAVKTLRDLSEYYAGATPSTKVKEYWDNGSIPWMSSGEVHMEHVTETESKITESGYQQTSTKMVPVHSVVIALAGQGKTRGKVAITEIPLCTNQSLCAIVPSKDIHYEYLYHNLKGRYLELRGMAGDVNGRGGLNLKIVQSIQVIVPPIDEQMKFVAIAEQADKSKFELKKSIEAIDKVIKSLINNI